MSEPKLKESPEIKIPPGFTQEDVDATRSFYEDAGLQGVLTMRYVERYLRRELEEARNDVRAERQDSAELRAQIARLKGAA